jgi:4a-hydroxytetrahydrobiopterin dehydratase
LIVAPRLRRPIAIIPTSHIEGYRDVSVELWTHAMGGLSENDFILAAKIDQLPVELKAK